MVVLTFTNKAAGGSGNAWALCVIRVSFCADALFLGPSTAWPPASARKASVQQLGYTPDFLVMDPEEGAGYGAAPDPGQKAADQIHRNHRLKKRLEQEG